MFFAPASPPGIGGVEASLVEGKIAGLATIGKTDQARKYFGEREKAHRFGNALNAAFSLRDDLKTLADDATMVCRCEDVEYGRLKEFDSWRSAKLQTRCGMGSCQGRVCGAATSFYSAGNRRACGRRYFRLEWKTYEHAMERRHASDHYVF